MKKILRNQSQEQIATIKRQSSILKLDTSHRMCQSQTRIIMTNWPMLNVNYGELRSIINDKIGDGTYEMR